MTNQGISTRPDKICVCGNVYEVTVYTQSSPEAGHFDCVSCGKRLDQWNSVRVPEHTLRSTPARTQWD